MKISEKFLGFCDYYGKQAKAYREVLHNGKWRFCIEIDGVRKVLMTY